MSGQVGVGGGGGTVVWFFVKAAGSPMPPVESNWEGMIRFDWRTRKLEILAIVMSIRNETKARQSNIQPLTIPDIAEHSGGKYVPGPRDLEIAVPYKINEEVTAHPTPAAEYTNINNAQNIVCPIEQYFGDQKHLQRKLRLLVEESWELILSCWIGSFSNVTPARLNILEVLVLTATQPQIQLSCPASLTVRVFLAKIDAKPDSLVQSTAREAGFASDDPMFDPWKINNRKSSFPLEQFPRWLHERKKKQ